jgi:hypothetical protein
MSMAAVTGLPDDASRLNTAVTERERLASVAVRGFARNVDTAQFASVSLRPVVVCQGAAVISMLDGSGAAS